MTKKKVTKKKEVVKKEVAKKAKAKKTVVKKAIVPEMISYSIRMTIPTGQYANVIPEIVVKAGTPDEAHAYIAPHMNKLWKEYYMVSDRKDSVVEKPKAKTVVVPVAKPTPVVTPAAKPAAAVVPDMPMQEESPVSDVALVKATQAIQSCLSEAALDLIIRQIAVSTKLTDEHKTSLLPIIEETSLKLNVKE